MSTSSLLNSVRTYLASHHMFVDDEWLAGCIEYLTEDSSTNYNEREIQNLAKEQWLLNDLKDICPGSLPANLKNQLKTTLNGRFVLQINACLDIGTPAYQQYLKLQKVNMENVEATTNFDDKVPSHRMIKLYLTDGVQTLSAIEYKPMRNLSCDITPGCKILIKGPVECRRGVLLLTESMIELLGGEVQEIAISNSLAGLVSSKLGLPVTQEPDQNTTITQPRNATLPAPHTQMPSRTDQHNLSVEDSRPVARVTSIQVSAFNDDDIDFDQLEAIEAQFDNRPSTYTNNERNRIDSQMENSGKRPLQDSGNKPEKKLKMELNASSDYPEDNDLVFEDEDYLNEMEAKFDREERSRIEGPKEPVVVSAEPFVFIKQINELSVSERAGRVFKVKGQIMKLLSKLSVGKDGWSLKCTIVDGTGSIDADFTSNVLSKLVGFTPQEMNQLKKQMVNNPVLKAKAVEALQKAKDSLQILYCIIELTILEVPQITCLIPFDDSHVDLLKKRTGDSGL
ncbi:recQ-mediated genome instability protein 1-like [Hyposmocoma kahamanoa]|uniref:recQ-mediated genome instability protein 1-like n=1 Tax=Hyposmocoma kahamanoa TaxID=1477025 RepID=UPI000E6D6E9F|nr:recQ-mediated genome instability protein 1-like [Hyposmocoma kahamanoa]